MSDTSNTTPAVIDLTPVEKVELRRPCLCGCGGFPTNPKARFIPGHDAKLKSMLIDAHLKGIESITIRDENGERNVTPMEWATELDWDPFLELAERRRDREAAAKAAKANS